MTGPLSFISAAVINRKLCDQHRVSCVNFAWISCVSFVANCPIPG
jgi:hypothetical protein